MFRNQWQSKNEKQVFNENFENEVNLHLKHIYDLILTNKVEYSALLFYLFK